MLQEHRTKVLKGNPLEVQRVIRTHVPSTKDSEAAGPHAMEGQKPPNSVQTTGGHETA